MVNSEMSAGKYTKTWDGLDKSGSQVASGIYFYRLQTNNFVKVRKMVLVR
jgi:flagellar hook assembly protein FlgD